MSVEHMQHYQPFFNQLGQAEMICYRILNRLWSRTLGPVSIYENTSYRKISWSLEVARFVFRIVRSLWNLTGTSAAFLPMCLSNFKAIRQFKVPISWLRDFTRSYDKTSFWILRRGPGTAWHLLPWWCLIYNAIGANVIHQIKLQEIRHWHSLKTWRGNFYK